MSDRIAEAFAAARQQGRAVLIPYLTAGDPDLETTQTLLTAVAESGADIIELGIPFSDPVADGPIIQKASERALAGGFKTRYAFDLVRAFRQRHQTAIVIFGYYNPILRMGGEAFAAQAADAGADGALVVDLSFEESDGLRSSLGERGLHLIPLLSPTTPMQRCHEIAAASTGFLYYVSMTGVTGAPLSGLVEVGRRVMGILAGTRLPVAVGFGVKEGDDVRAIASFADGVVVGSELIRRVNAAGPAGATGAARSFLRELRAAAG
jgi:tryptophan synthase alpha chain